MIRPAPRVIAIDDSQEDLDKLTQGINRYGAACLPFHFTGDTEDLHPCPHVRVIFADLHLNETGAGSDNKQHFSVIGNLISETIKPSGPYLLILWTNYAKEADSLRRFLYERLVDTPKPFAVKAIDKEILLLGGGKNGPNIEKLAEKITSLFDQFPQIAALLNWEEMVLGAAGDTVSSIFDLVRGRRNPDKEVRRILAHLAVSAVGKDHVENDRFYAVNEALLPILTDRITAMRLKNEDGNIWQNAFDSSDSRNQLSQEEAARLNGLIHIAPAIDTDTGTKRGVVIALPERFSGDNFKNQFSLTQEEAALKQFSCKEDLPENLDWVLIQCQAVCDYAQNRRGPLPYYLGLELSHTLISKNKRPEALWVSPPFERNDSMIYLSVNARFQVSPPEIYAGQEKVLYRLREQLLNDLIYRIHSYSARPGMLSFR